MKSNEQSDLIFSLDIGTRSVIGIVGKSENGIFYVKASQIREHPQRAMMDGQIEDIAAVAKVAQEVKQALEDELGTKLTSVCVAAAGRALRTTRAFFEEAVPGAGSITGAFISDLEMHAIGIAADDVRRTEGGAELLCVGHSVIKYTVDGYNYTNILEHKGKTASVEIIATFLPTPVVTSLESAMQKISLSVESLTLEPIAAMNAVIPKELRLLNLALVDIGAGTSDIAICDEGSIAAYTMATIAGDEITEAIIRAFLVDFQTAESIKHAAAQGDKEITYYDIMGFEYKQSYDAVIKAIGPALGQLTDTVCEKILEVNGRAPAAVFLVGGGSRTPLLCELVAKRLGLDERKVAIGGNNFMKKLTVSEIDIFGPEYATPLGIAFTASEGTGRKAFDIQLNGERRRLMRTGALTFIDVILLCGYTYADIMGKSGKGISYELNGKLCTARGGMLRPATLVLGGEAATISSAVKSGDVLHFAPAINGANAAARIRDILPQSESFEVLFNGEPKKAGRRIFVNGKECAFDYLIEDGDSIVTVSVSTLGELLIAEKQDDNDTTYFINKSISAKSKELIAGDIITMEHSVKQVFAVEPLQQEQEGEQQPENELPELEKAQQDTELEPQDTEQELQEGEQPAATDSKPQIKENIEQGINVLLNGEVIELPQKPDGTHYLFFDMLERVDIDTSKPQGDIVLMLNKKSARFLDEIASGDCIDIYWEKR